MANKRISSGDVIDTSIPFAASKSEARTGDLLVRGSTIVGQKGTSPHPGPSDTELRPPKADPYMQSQLDNMEKDKPGSSASVPDEEIMPKAMVEERRRSRSESTSGSSSNGNKSEAQNCIQIERHAREAAALGFGGYSGDTGKKNEIEAADLPSSKSLPRRALDATEKLATEVKNSLIETAEDIKNRVTGAGSGGAEFAVRHSPELLDIEVSLLKNARHQHKTSQEARNFRASASDSVRSTTETISQSPPSQMLATGAAKVRDVAAHAVSTASDTAESAAIAARNAPSAMRERTTNALHGAQNLVGSIQRKPAEKTQGEVQANDETKERSSGRLGGLEQYMRKAFENAESGGDRENELSSRSTAIDTTKVGRPSAENEQRDLKRSLPDMSG
ncbi:hypothetical protein HDU93_005371, partial [Gonapodya sp. JEL0774]